MQASESQTDSDTVQAVRASDSAANNDHVTYNGESNQSSAVADAPSRFSKATTKLRSLLKRENKPKQKTVSIRQLFRFANKVDGMLMVVATFCSLAHGVGMPLLLVIFGDITTLFVQFSGPLYANGTIGPMPDASKEGLMHGMRVKAGAFAGIGGAVLLVAYAQVAFWLTVAHRQTFKIRVEMLAAVLRQDIGYFDTHDSSGLSTRLSDDVNKIHEGIGDKVGGFFQWISTAIAGIIIALVKGWKLALVLFAFTPIIAICGALMMYLTAASTNKELTAYAKAGSVASEVFGAIRTVFMFGGQEKECARYGKNLLDARRSGIIKSMITGGGIGATYFVLFSSYCLAYWYGGKLVGNGEYQVGDMLIIFFCVIFGSLALGNASPNLQSIGVSRGAAHFIYELIDRQPPIDSRSTHGLCPDELTGNVDFKDVKFHYPSRPEVPILQGLNLSIANGQTVALVGGSGCGKSTVVQLIQRFYDPLDGIVTIDGIDVKTLNVKWLRQHIGVVSQEPCLFALSIAENIRYGRDGITDEDIERAAREANAHDFISQLPQKYETLVGERGAQLSGGQKQRIAIARALVRDPKILLLDEATSALDTESEAAVQAAMDKARPGRTTIIVAHRLSTIKTADVIYGIQDGVVHEYGTHDELMERPGIYHKLVNNQTNSSDGESENIVDDAALDLESQIAATPHLLEKVDDIIVEDEEEEIPAAKLKDVGMMKLLRFNASEWHFILIGCINAIIHGGVQPIFAILMGGILNTFRPNTPPDERDAQILFLSLMYLVIGAASGLSMFFSSWMFGISGEALTMRMRCDTFRAMLGQDMSFFDNPKHSTGALTTRLATDASNVQGATGVRLGMMLQALATIACGLVIGFVYSWKFALFILGIVPFIGIGAMMQMRIAKGLSGKSNKDLENAGKVASEAISNIRTVASLSRENKFVEEYTKLTEIPYRTNLKMAHVFGFAFSFTQAMIFFCYAAIFYFGAWLIAYDGLEYDAMFKVFGAIIFGAITLGRESQFAPDYGKAKMSAARVFALIRLPANIYNYSTDGLQPGECNGSVGFNDAEFSYPSRPTVKVLKGINLGVEKGQTVALVGSSGCGKSTTVQLLERLYDVSAGQVMLDGRDVRELNIGWLRNQLGIVSQEPTLFDYSIRENIEYGDNTRHVTIDDVMTAARLANIHNFIEALPEGYETRVGDKGTQLSGGQKQRIAIARSLVRNPKVLLLDEATSALDTESEKIVQEALDRAQRGRTCLVIAHRLSTIQNADSIVVFHNGQVREQGTHNELMAQRGLYFKLQMAQARKT